MKPLALILAAILAPAAAAHPDPSLAIGAALAGHPIPPGSAIPPGDTLTVAGAVRNNASPDTLVFSASVEYTDPDTGARKQTAPVELPFTVDASLDRLRIPYLMPDGFTMDPRTITLSGDLAWGTVETSGQVLTITGDSLKPGGVAVWSVQGTIPPAVQDPGGIRQ